MLFKIPLIRGKGGETETGLRRPAAVAAGAIGKDHYSRFGWHNLRHSLATFFGSAHIHSVNSKQAEAQGKYLEAIKLGKDGKEAA